MARGEQPQCTGTQGTQAVTCCPLCPSRPCLDLTNIGPVSPPQAALSTVPTHPLRALWMTSTTQVSLLHSCLGEPGSDSSSHDGLAGCNKVGVMGEEGLPPPSFHFLELMSSLHVSSLPRDLFPWLQQAVAGLHGAAAMCMWGQHGVLKMGRLEIPERLGPLGGEGQGTPPLSVCRLWTAPGSVSSMFYFFVYNTSDKGEQHPGSHYWFIHQTALSNTSRRQKRLSFIHSLPHSVHF